jgi:hypothetical protein
MSATTIKLEGELVARLKKVMPRSISLSGYVRSLIEGDIRRHTLAEAALKYQEFLASNESEREWLEEWSTADLAHPPQEGDK